VSAKRSPAPPPNIPGYRYVSLLGSGGFADVYLYEQDRPRRRVAIKVLLSDLRTEGARRAFESEANLMAQLSSHPYIVTIYEANVTGDGHSYLAMEYCSRPSLDVRYRRARLSVAEALTIGVQVSSAVESAHRAGIAHRDIKPANILVTDYNRPALTDFGISAAMDAAPGEDQGMSIPWSPPEVLHGGGADGVPVDVWALGATVYTLLAGRSPFVFPGMDNSQRQLMARIGSMPLQRTGRDDVPGSLELALATAMSKAPGARYGSAHSFALALQRIQTEMGLGSTPFEVLDDSVHQDGEADDAGELTRVRKVVAIDPDPTTAAVPVPPAPPQPGALDAGRDGPEPWEDRTVLRGGSAPSSGDAPPVETTLHRPSPAEAPAGQPEEGRRSRAAVVTVAALAAVAVAVGVVALALGNGPSEEPGPPPGLTRPPADPLAGLEGQVPGPENITGRPAGGAVAFSWDNPDPRKGDIYRFRTVTLEGGNTWIRTRQRQARVERQQGRTCIDVQTTRSNGTASEPQRACWPE
jgi:serine/threonine protein kinase